MTTSTTTQPNLKAKASLAKLMAAENLQVEVSSSASTACFNLMDRTLTLPLWEVGDEAYNMLVGHEVSHALFTPPGDALKQACESISKKHTSIARDYINVVEDARIERLIKSEYPGLRRSFAEGYREFMKRDLFQISGKDLSGMGFLDRINLHYKIGWSNPVPFSSEEMPLVRRVAETTTWEEVVALSKEIYEFVKEKREEEKQQEEQEQEQEQGEQGEESTEGPEGSQSQEGEETESSEPGSESEETEESEEAESPESEQGEEGEESEESDSSDSSDSSDESSEESGEGEESEGEEGEEEGSDAGEGEGEGEEHGEESDIAPEGASTVNALEEGLKTLAPRLLNPVKTFELPTLESHVVIPFSEVESMLSQPQFTSETTKPETFYSCWKSQESANVQALWTEFERRKAADAFRREEVSPTGRLDPMRMAYHKVSEDLFLSNVTVRDGKNHGLFLLLDMSGSMSDKFWGTMIQLVNLAAFARRANIPFVVYGFAGETPNCFVKKPVRPAFKGKGWENAASDDFRLVTLLESGLSQSRFQSQIGRLLRWAASWSLIPRHYSSQTGYVNRSAYSDSLFGLKSTPTNSALLASIQLVAAFKSRHRLQVVNTIVLTDGEATDTPLSAFERTDHPTYGMMDTLPVLRDPMTRREYRAFNKSEGGYSHVMYRHQQQSLLAEIIKDRTGSNMMMISLVNRSADFNATLKMIYGMKETEKENAHGTLRSDGWIMMNSTYGYGRVAALKIENEPGTSDFEKVDVDMESKRSLTNLNKAFIKSLENRKTYRPLMAKIAEVISGNLS